MKLEFRGWGREVTTHNHPVMPIRIKGTTYHPCSEEKPLEWSDPFTAYGKVTGLALNGAFLVKLDFTAAELGNWMVRFATARPLEALRIIQAAQVAAIQSLEAVSPSSTRPE